MQYSTDNTITEKLKELTKDIVIFINVDNIIIFCQNWVYRRKTDTLPKWGRIAKKNGRRHNDIILIICICRLFIVLQVFILWEWKLFVFIILFFWTIILFHIFDLIDVFNFFVSWTNIVVFRIINKDLFINYFTFITILIIV